MEILVYIVIAIIIVIVFICGGILGWIIKGVEAIFDFLAEGWSYTWGCLLLFFIILCILFSFL